MPCRICVVSLLRVLFINNLDLVDFSYSSNGLGRWSFLEPSLGVVNTCLPVMRPALLKILGSHTMTWAAKGSRHGSSDQRWIPMRAKEIGTTMTSHPKQFRPLVDWEHPFDGVSISGRPSAMASSATQASEPVKPRSPTLICSLKGIRCTTEWNVETTVKRDSQ